MESPFPGMDPYLEEPSAWRGVHHWLISAIADQLRPQLRPRGYFADVESRVWLEESIRSVYPDVAVRRADNPPVEAGVEVLIADEPVRVRADVSEVREDYLQIYEAGNRKLVTGIEVVSPSNKDDTTGRSLYERKRRELETCGVNLVEIDVLREGRPVVRLPTTVLDPGRRPHYVVNVIRRGSGDYEFYPVDLKHRLPRVGIPLRAGEPDAVLDLQAALTRVYEAGSFDMRIDYRVDPVPPLNPADAEWAGRLLTERGLRPARTPDEN